MGIRVERPTSIQAFLELAGEFLEAREAEHNLMLGLCSTLQANPEIFEVPPQFAVAMDGDRVVAAALVTPPRNLVLSVVLDLQAVSELVDALADLPLPGVTGLSVPAREFADRWTATTGRLATLDLAERVYRLTEVIPARPAPGRARLAESRDRQTLIEQVEAFAAEALHDTFPGAGDAVDRWIGQVGGRQMWVWEDDGAIVSLAGVGGITPHGIRIGPVYTPPVMRRRGYAGNVTAAASQAQLDRGRQFVTLFTDLANPTSNHVYQAIGYEPVADVDQWSFGPEAGEPA